MPRFEIELNHEGIDELLKCEGVQSLLASCARKISSDCEVYVERTRAVSEAYGDNRNNNMLKRLK